MTTEAVAPFGQAYQALGTIPGIGEQTAQGIIAEVGVNMSVFADAVHLPPGLVFVRGNTSRLAGNDRRMLVLATCIWRRRWGLQRWQRSRIRGCSWRTGTGGYIFAVAVAMP